MVKGRSVRDLSSIDALFSGGTKEKPFAEQLHESLNAPPPVEDIQDAVLNLMSVGRGFTAGEVQRHLGTHPDADRVPAIMSKFANEGRFEIMATTGRVNSYTLRKAPVETLTSARSEQSNKTWRQTDPMGVRQAPDPMGVIVLEEGLDVAIWKIMRDGKYRSKNEICMILIEYKFDRILANRRVESMINSRNYFDRRDGGSGGMRYAMKKHVSMPGLQNSEPTKVANFNAKDNVTEAPQEAPKFSGHMPHSAGKMDLGVAAVEAALKQEGTEGDQPEAQQADAEPAVMPVDIVITKNDTNAQAVWKALYGGSWFKTPEIVMLVQTALPDLSANAISASLSNLHKDGTVERTPVEGARYFNYRLVDGKPMPADNRMASRFTKKEVDELKSKVDPRQQDLLSKQEEVAAEAPQQTGSPAAEPAAPVVDVATAAAPVEAQSQSNQEEMINTMANPAPLIKVNAPDEVKVDVPLIDLAIEIKGTKFTFTELRTITQELSALGYGRNEGAAQKLTLVKQTVELKGIVFDKDELDTIVKTLVNEGFNKHIHAVR